MDRARIMMIVAAVAVLTTTGAAAESPGAKKASAPAAEAKPAAAPNPAASQPAAASQRRPRYPKAGSTAPTFEFTTLNGARHKLADFRRGKTVALILFESACGPCTKELRRVETEIAQQMAQEGVVVLAIARDGKAEALKQLKKDMKVSFAIAEDPDRKIYNLFTGENDVPRNYVIDPRGQIAFESVGYDEAEFPKFVEALKKANAKPAAAPAKTATAAKPAEPAKPAAPRKANAEAKPLPAKPATETKPAPEKKK